MRNPLLIAALLILLPAASVRAAPGTPGRADADPSVAASAPAAGWTRQFGTDVVDRATDVKVDGSGNVYVVGITSGALVPGRNRGEGDAFIRRYAAGGTVTWTRQFGTTADDGAFAAAIDAAGNIYVVGRTAGVLHGRNAGFADGFIRKYAPDGSPVWTRQFGTPADEFISSVAVDRTGSVYVGGWTAGDLGETNHGTDDAFLRKYTSTGSVLWTHQFGTTEQEWDVVVATAPSGAVYVAGRTYGDLVAASPGSPDGFLRRIRSNGSVAWTKGFGTSGGVLIDDLIVDATGAVYVGGRTRGDMGGSNAGPGWFDPFVRKYTASGGVSWTRQFGSDRNEWSLALATDTSGNIKVAGTTEGDLARPAEFDDLFLRTYTPAGAAGAVRQFGTAGMDYASAIAVAATGGVYIAGSTDGTFAGGSNRGQVDAFLCKGSCR